MDNSECKAEFRFRKEDIPVLAEALGIQKTFTCSQGSVSDGIEGLCIMLKRFSYPCRYSDLRRNPLENQVIVPTSGQKSHNALHAKFWCCKVF